ncbi:MAG: ATP-binding protein [bacterium]|nr:ATP-binding protein [bacterium]
MLNELFHIHHRNTSAISLKFKRYLYHEINWDNRLVLVTGARGTGKTTLVLQHFLERYNDIKKCLYLSADNPLVLKEGIYNTGSEYFKYYGDCLIIDEVHKQKDWSIQVKGLYDAYPGKKLIVLGSSTLNILYEKGDLSRRAVIYSLQPLSFREYLEMKYEKKIAAHPFGEILSRHVEIAHRLGNDFESILRDFNDYLECGSFPFFMEYSAGDYLNALSNVLDKMIYEDVTTIKTLKAFSSLKLKKLLGFLSTSKIPLFNLETLKNEIEVSRDTIYEYFDLLDRAEIVKIVRTESKNRKVFKNSKILFKSPNIYFAIAFELWKSGVDKGNIRESFFASQVGRDYPVFSSINTDFLVIDGERRFEIEVGGKSKGRKQIKDLDNAYVFKDGIDIGFADSIPLYLAGFLY